MFLLLDVSDTGLSGYEFMRALYERRKVSVLDGAAFGKSHRPLRQNLFRYRSGDHRRSLRPHPPVLRAGSAPDCLSRQSPITWHRKV